MSLKKIEFVGKKIDFSQRKLQVYLTLMINVNNYLNNSDSERSDINFTLTIS